MPLASVAWEQSLSGGSHTISLDLARSSQLPGYTALNSPPTGLFGGNPDLGREFTNTLTLGYERTKGAWHSQAAFFARRDDKLADWTFRQDAPFARQANPVDLDVIGAEFILEWVSVNWQLTGGYTFIDKDADYGNAEVDASYYALNFARHRATLAVSYQPTTQLEIRLDNEYRIQEKKPCASAIDRHGCQHVLFAGAYPPSPNCTST